MLLLCPLVTAATCILTSPPSEKAPLLKLWSLVWHLWRGMSNNIGWNQFMGFVICKKLVHLTLKPVSISCLYLHQTLWRGRCNWAWLQVWTQLHLWPLHLQMRKRPMEKMKQATAMNNLLSLLVTMVMSRVRWAWCNGMLCENKMVLPWKVRVPSMSTFYCHWLHFLVLYVLFHLIWLGAEGKQTIEKKISQILITTINYFMIKGSSTVNQSITRIRCRF